MKNYPICISSIHVLIPKKVGKKTEYEKAVIENTTAVMAENHKTLPENLMKVKRKFGSEALIDFIEFGVEIGKTNY